MKRRRLILLLAALPLLSGLGGRDATSEARRDANRFILEKLRRQQGEGWQRSGQLFLWRYGFSADGCELRIQRRDIYGDNELRQRVPVAEVLPVWPGGGSLGLYCQATTDCIEFKYEGPQLRQEGRLGETPLLVPQPDDLPKLRDAFAELNRLCDDPYRR